jgi:putative cardiolipin synthase
MQGKLRKLLLCGVLLFLYFCAAVPEDHPRLTPDDVAAPRLGGGFASLASNLQREHGADASGFMLLDSNEDGLRWRLALIDQSRHTLDVQCFVWYGDTAGLLLLKHVVLAADRGVHVRVIVDDLLTFSRDFATARLDTHPNIEIRFFNPWIKRSVPGRVVEGLGRMEQLNQRMHNKLVVADNQVAVLGGRNIGDEHFGLNPDYNYHDLDVLGVGPVARQVSIAFDAYWNSPWVVPAAALNGEASPADVKKTYERISRKLRESKALERFPSGARDWSDEFNSLSGNLKIGRSRILYDSPEVDALRHHVPAGVQDLFSTAREELLIVNAFIIPDSEMIDSLQALRQRGVNVKILTNSLASYKIPAINSHYKRWRKPLMEAGVDLYEIRPDASIRKLVADTPPTESEFMGLHIKAAVVDRKHVYIGSMNLDPRSMELNSEVGALIESPALAEALARLIERGMAPENSWRLQVDSRGDVQWVSGSEVLRTQPARSVWQRVQDWFFMMFPSSLY